MDDLTRFESRFETRVQAFAKAGVLAVDSAAVARAVALGHPRNARVRWLGLTLDRRTWTMALAFGLLAVVAVGALVFGARLLAPPALDQTPPANGLIAFTVSQPNPAGIGPDTDIWFTALDGGARRVVGSAADSVNQLCPAFSPDGRSLAYGSVVGRGADRTVDDRGMSITTGPATYQKAALMVADVSDDGRLSDRLSVDIGDGLPPPCPVWSPDGSQVAFGVNRTSPINPAARAAGSEVWIVTLADRGITVVPDLLATDLEWSPDGTLLAVASGDNERREGNLLHDGRIRLYSPSSGAMHPLDGTMGAFALTWSPDGRRIAYERLADPSADGDNRRQLVVVDAETGQEEIVDPAFEILHGIGPIWSPDGETIAYQRGVGGEHSEVVLLTPGDLSDESARPREAVVLETAKGSGERLDPYRVTWSPDGRYLLMMAWGVPPDTTTGEVEDPFFVAVPVDPALPAPVLSRMDGLVIWDGYDDTTFVPIQAWGRAPSD